jgi:hypothetical protein
VLLAAFLVWLAVVEPVNREVAAALRLHRDMVPAVWSELAIDGSTSTRPALPFNCSGCSRSSRPS